MQKQNGLIFAADLKERRKTLNLTRKISDYIDAVKVNYPLVLSTGAEIISDLSDITDVIADFKLADVPHINSRISKIAFNKGASAVICHAFTGEESLKSCTKTASEFDGEVYSVVNMSHPGSEDVMDSSLPKLCEISKKADIDGVIAPGNQPDKIEMIKNKIDTKILSPGIGAQGGKGKKAISAGADYIIVGRSIYDSTDPVKSAKKIRDNIKMYYSNE
ncbi:MAG: Orotidine-5'-phosphate decarboxylase PyrF [Candidatus Methanohalarchaeum thermophilum]|uniref:Orotidine 5'-phosphate decarboxylase n=1 Tax=Methanohalarchaeum thermophilum TaxID=1903181 RepID=A0A1Q6DUP7_METT1|nr:MAG: Orotidine-5'-phosphate decarboxylase PyrF [Candidatus Methanohalarchaeum thermophilum]